MSRRRRKKLRKPSRKKQLKEWSRQVRDRDGNACVVCGSKNYIQGHHILAKATWTEVALEPMNGISLCARHHHFGRLNADNALWFSEWLRTNRPKQWLWVWEKIAAFVGGS